MVGVELRHPGPQPVADRVLGEVPQPAADDVTAGVAGQRVEPDQDHVDRHQHGAEAHVDAVVLARRRPEGQEHVVRQDHADHDGGVPEVAVDVLHQQREPRLAAVGGVRLGHGARGRRQPERPVVGLPVVVAGHPEAQREDQDDQRSGERPPLERLSEVRGALDAVAEAGRVERRQVGLGEVVTPHERPDGGVDDERTEDQECRQRRQPPSVRAERSLLDLRSTWPLYACRHLHLQLGPRLPPSHGA